MRSMHTTPSGMHYMPPDVLPLHDAHHAAWRKLHLAKRPTDQVVATHATKANLLHTLTRLHTPDYF
jgi:hypothetical protein